MGAVWFLRPPRSRRWEGADRILLHMYCIAILVHMKTTLHIDDELLAEARRLTSIEEKTALVRAGLEALIARESARRLSALGGTQPKLGDVPRRRSASRQPT